MGLRKALIWICLRYFSIFLILLVFPNSSVRCQSPHSSWAISHGGDGYDYSKCIATDPGGNNYTVGYYYSSFLSFGSTVLTNSFPGTLDCFIVKHDPSGSFKWALSSGGEGSESIFSICCDNSGNIYVTGTFTSHLFILGRDTVQNCDTSGQTIDIFISKIDSSGSILWLKSIGGTQDEYAYSIAVDLPGNIYLTGPFNSPLFPIDNDTLSNADQSGSYNDFYLLKLDNSGHTIWARSAGNNHSEFGTSLAVDQVGCVYITGNFYSATLTFGNITLINSGVGDVFIVKYDSSGVVKWAKNPTGNSYTASTALQTDRSGNVYVTGNFNGPNLSFNGFILNNTGGSDLFLAKYDSAGTFLWAKKAGGIGMDEGEGIAIAENGNSYITGYFHSEYLRFGNSFLFNQGISDIFIVAFDSSGNELWGKPEGSEGSEAGSSIAISTNNELYITGLFLNRILLIDNFTLTNSDSSGNSLDFFIEKIEAPDAIPITTLSTFFVNTYPNPASASVQVYSDERMERIEVTDPSGRIILCANPNSSNYILNLGQSGIFFMHVQTGKGSLTKKILIQR